MRLIGLNGRKGSGKDQTFAYIEQHCAESGIACARFAFADPLKISAMRALGYEGTDEECISFANEVKESGLIHLDTISDHVGITITGRSYLQRYGTEAHRDVFGDEFWIDVALPRASVVGSRDDRDRENIRALADRYPGVDVLVGTDVRFTNEAERIRSLGGEIWYIARPSLNLDAHASEQPLMPHLIDKVVENNDSLVVLYNNAIEALTT